MVGSNLTRNVGAALRDTESRTRYYRVLRKGLPLCSLNRKVVCISIFYINVHYISRQRCSDVNIKPRVSIDQEASEATAVSYLNLSFLWWCCCIRPTRRHNPVLSHKTDSGWKVREKKKIEKNAKNNHNTWKKWQIKYKNTDTNGMIGRRIQNL